jgi:hypothetical protein
LQQGSLLGLSPLVYRHRYPWPHKRRRLRWTRFEQSRYARGEMVGFEALRTCRLLLQTNGN